MTETTQHTNPAFDREMDKMHSFLADMEAGVLSQLSEMENAFSDMDKARARKILNYDSRLNDMEGRALRQAIAVLARYHPVAEDLRTVVSVLYAAAEYERMGDYVKNIAKSVSVFAVQGENLKVFPLILDMMKAVRKQLEEFIDARESDNLEKAVVVWHQDSHVDKLFKQAVGEAADNQAAGDGDARSLVYAISSVNNLERLGDRVKNLAEIFHYRKTNTHLVDPDAGAAQAQA